MINMLPPSLRRQQLARRRGIQWGSIVCLVLLSGWTWHWYERRETLVLSQQLESLEREQAPTQTMLKQLFVMRQQLDELQQQEAVATELEHHRNALTLLHVISNTAEATNGRLRVTRMELADFQNTNPPAEAAPAGSATTSGLLLAGVSLDNPAVVELLDGLQDSGIFRRVELLSSKEREDGSLLRDYELRCEF
jgi:hypothetical protein